MRNGVKITIIIIKIDKDFFIQDNKEMFDTDFTVKKNRKQVNSGPHQNYLC